ncbi:MAG: hypothetical protein GY842_03685 [bacterium]|nr:hypothetical protein [bacterium]
MTWKRKAILAILAATFVGGVSAFCAPTAMAQCGYGGIRYGSGYGGYNRGYSYHRSYRAPVYHAPSVHLDRVYHHDYNHWTPRRGLHSHGHYDLIPHYTPGHFDTLHRGHLHGNPRYHH